MNVKRYIAKSMPEAMEAIRRDLGRDAIILSQRTFRKKGLIGLLQKRQVEVMVAYGAPEPEPAAKPARSAATAEETAPAAAAKPAAPAPQEEKVTQEEIARMAKQLADIKEMVRSAAQQEDRLGAPSAEEKIADPLMEKVIQALTQHDVDESIAALFAQRAWKEAEHTYENPQHVLRRLIAQRIGMQETVEFAKDKRHIILLAGPTGNGKTTTLVKIAGLCLCRPGVKVGLINTDTYRIGAYDQIRIYSDILEIPLNTVNTVEELKRALAEQADRDIILIDTAGKNSWDTVYQDSLKMMIEAAQPDEILLVISINTSRRAVREILANYSFIGNCKLIITKLDEVRAWGNILNIMIASGRPLSYVTTGQSVPDDIEKPDVEKILARILPEKIRL